MNYSQANGYPVFGGLSLLKGIETKTKFQTLSLSEIEALQNLELHEEHLKNAKDWLLISCWTGQRVSDFMRFNTNMISQQNINGDDRYFIEFVQKKTAAQVRLPLDSRLVEILKARDWNFPSKMSDQRYNEHIKTVAKLAGICENVEGSLTQMVKDSSGKEEFYRKIDGSYPKCDLITSHIGRRTFATNNWGKIPIPLLMSASGHTTPKMLMNYVGKTDQTMSNALAEYII